MAGQTVISGKAMRVLLATTLLLAASLYLGCRKEQPPTETQQQTTEQTTPPQETVAEPQAETQLAASEKIPLKVLYVGLADTERQQDFVDFLGKHFEHVATADYNNFQESQTEDCDVAIFDKDGIEWRPLNIKVSDRYSRATMTIGVPGAFWCDRRRLKTGYM